MNDHAELLRAHALLTGRDVASSADLQLLGQLFAAGPAALRAMLNNLQDPGAGSDPTVANARSTTSEGDEAQDLTLLTLASASVVDGRLVLPKPTMLLYRVKGYALMPQPPAQLEECQTKAGLLCRQLSGEGGPSASALLRYHPLYHLTLALIAVQHGHQVRFMKEARPDDLSIERTVGSVTGALEDEPEGPGGPEESEQH